MTEATYTHGHHDSVLRSHRWRTAENSAGYLLPLLRRSQSVLDVGCGPGTITSDLARLVAPGCVVGIDPSTDVLDEARQAAAEAGVDTVTFEEGSVYGLRFEDGSFDVVHAHQVLQHLGEPQAALAEMARVCRPGGIVAARDSDFPTMRFYPDDEDLARAIATYGRLTERNGATWDAGRRLLAWARGVGFSAVAPSASVWCFATPDTRAWWGGLWADRFLYSSLADQLLDHGLATRADLESFAAAYRRWADTPDGWFTVVHGEVVCTR